jgi:hypothetical protein
VELLNSAFRNQIKMQLSNSGQNLQVRQAAWRGRAFDFATRPLRCALIQNSIVPDAQTNAAKLSPSMLPRARFDVEAVERVG